MPAFHLKLSCFVLFCLFLNIITYAQDAGKEQSGSSNQAGKAVVLEKDTAKTYGYHRISWVKEIDWFENRFLSPYLFKSTKDTTRSTESDSLSQQKPLNKRQENQQGVSPQEEFTMEELIAYQRSKGYGIDTNLTSFQRYNVVEQAAYRRQDLSNSGTPSQAIFDRTPTDIGIRWGISTLNPYILHVHEIPYYDTQSPMTEWRYSQGGDGRIRMDVRFTRNVHSRWNVGALYGRASGRVLRGYRSVRKNDFQTIHENILFHTSYQSRAKQYRLMAHFFAFRNNTKETGGIHADSLVNSGNVEGVSTFDDLFRLGTGALNNRLTDVRSYQRESRYYLYHQLGLLDSALQYRTLQVFQSLQYRSHKFTYKDNKYATNFNNFYDNISTYSRPIAGVASFQNQYFFDMLEQRIGLKSSFQRFFIAAYYKTRFYTWQYNSLPDLKIPIQLPTQHFVGAHLRVDFSEDFYWRTKAEHILNGNSSIESSLFSRWGQVGASVASYQNDMLWAFHNSPVFYWNKPDRTMRIAKVFLMPRIRLPREKGWFEPFVEAYHIENYFFYNQEAQPSSLRGHFQYTLTGAKFDLKTGSFRHIGFYQFAYDASQTQKIRMPTHFINYEIFWDKRVLKNILWIQAGLDIHWRSLYFADAFMPVTQQFYLQDKQPVGNYLLTTVFMNLRLKKTNLFFKIHNLTQGLLGKGYYFTPDYMGQPRQLDFGLLWQLFD